MTTIPESKVKVENVGNVSTNFYWKYDYNGQEFNNQTTVRDDTPIEVVKKNIQIVLEAQAHIIDLGGIAREKGASLNERAPSAPASSIPMMDAKTDHPTEEARPEQPAAPLSFPTEKLSVSMTDGKKYFKIKGGQFKKYGVTVWPEVLQAIGMNTEAAEIKEYDFPGWNAIYAIKEDGSGHPSKVTKLEKVAK